MSLQQRRVNHDNSTQSAVLPSTPKSITDENALLLSSTVNSAPLTTIEKPTLMKPPPSSTSYSSRLFDAPALTTEERDDDMYEESSVTRESLNRIAGLLEAGNAQLNETIEKFQCAAVDISTQKHRYSGLMH